MSIDLLDTAKGRYTYKNNSRCQIVYAKGKVLLFYLLGILIFLLFLQTMRCWRWDVKMDTYIYSTFTTKARSTGRIILFSGSVLIYCYTELLWSFVFTTFSLQLLLLCYFKGHMKFVTNLDWSTDSRFLQSVDGDFELHNCKLTKHPISV